MHIPSTSSGHAHVQRGGTLKRQISGHNRHGFFKLKAAPVPQVGTEVCIYFAFCLCIYDILIIASMQDVPYW